MNPKQQNRVIRTSREGWILVDISTAKYPDAAMYIEAVDWNYIQSLGYGRVHAWKGNNSTTIYTRCGKYSIHTLLFPNSIDVDHKNHNGCDNRRKNLRPCTRLQNGMNRQLGSNNTSGVKGVYWYKRKELWAAQIKINGCNKILGYYSSINEAAEVRRKAEAKYFGEFACD